MTTYPLPADPVSALTSADGTTRAHSLDHGKVSDMWVNWKQYLKGDNTEESAAQVSALNTAIQGKISYIPKGQYRFPSGTGIILTSNTHIIGAGMRLVTIYYNTTNCFSGTSLSSVRLEGFYMDYEGGGVPADLDNTCGVLIDSASTCTLYDVGGNCVAPVIYLKGCVGNYIIGCRAQWSEPGYPGIKLDDQGSTLAFCNANVIERCTVIQVQDPADAAVYIGGGGGNVVRDCDFESNHGYGVYLSGSTMCTVASNWFEGNGNDNIYTTSGPTLITGNKFHHHRNGAEVTAQHVRLTGGSAYIIGNLFQDDSASGVDVTLAGSNSVVAANSGLASLTDNGTNSTIFPNGQSGVQMKLPGTATEFHIETPRTAAASGGSLSSDEMVFSVSNATDDNWFGIGSRGVPIFRTGNNTAITGSDELPTSAFAFYYDEATASIRARIRKGGGAYDTYTVGGGFGGTYTVTNHSTDRTYNANATSIDELADVLGTLIADLRTAGIVF